MVLFADRSIDRILSMGLLDRREKIAPPPHADVHNLSGL